MQSMLSGEFNWKQKRFGVFRLAYGDFEIGLIEVIAIIRISGHLKSHAYFLNRYSASALSIAMPNIFVQCSKRPRINKWMARHWRNCSRVIQTAGQTDHIYSNIVNYTFMPTSMHTPSIYAKY